MENRNENKQNFGLLLASVVLNLILVFFIFYGKKDTSKLEVVAQQFVLEKEQGFNKALQQHKHNRKILNSDLLLISGADSTSLQKLMEGKVPHIIMISGFKNCTTCLYSELDRLKANPPKEKFVVIAMRGLEDEFYYFWKQNKLQIPLYFANLQMLGLDPNGFPKPFYFVTDSTLLVSDLVLAESNDHSDFINRYWTIIQER
jgi:hypothetical protein